MTTYAPDRRTSLRLLDLDRLEGSEIRAAYEAAKGKLSDPARTLLDWLLQETPFGRGVAELVVNVERLARDLSLSTASAYRAVRRLDRDGFLVHHSGRGSQEGTVLAPAPWLPTLFRPQPRTRLLSCFLAEAEPQPTAPAPAKAQTEFQADPDAQSAGLLESAGAERSTPAAAMAGDLGICATPAAEVERPLPPPASLQPETPSLSDAEAEAELAAVLAVKAKPPQKETPSRTCERAPARHGSYSPSNSKPSIHSGMGDGSLAPVERMGDAFAAVALAPAGGSRLDPTPARPSTPPPKPPPPSAPPLAAEAWGKIQARAEELARLVDDPKTDPRIFLWAAIQESGVPVPGWRSGSRLSAKQVDYAATACRKATTTRGGYFLSTLKAAVAKLGGAWKGLVGVGLLVAHLTGGAA